jgi:hypothetical protein
MNITVTASMDVGQDGRKRQRITTACLGCREKKTKVGSPMVPDRELVAD